MAAGPRQSELRRRISFRLPHALTALAALGAACLWLPAPAAMAAEEPSLASGYEPQAGEPFFLLSDATYGSGDEAKVRLEASSGKLSPSYGGVDITLYRVPKPLEFLQKQKNLHRVTVAPNPAGEGLSNTMTHLWDVWVKKSRFAWQGLFTPEVRQAMTKAAPELKTPKGFDGASDFRQQPQFKPIKGLELIDRFRYPVHAAKPIEPPASVKLAGSSSEFIRPAEGNVMVPLGKRKPGLYLVEASLGSHRATTLVFVADTVAITKVSSSQMLAWTAHREHGKPVGGVKLAWIDGTGTLKTGATDDRGVAILEHDSPERTYLIGEDPAGGVFISENFYYDSEIYNAKLYAVTDRPLYRPGDPVFVKFIGREFRSSRESAMLAKGELVLNVFDPNGLPILRQKLTLQPESGADTSFRLPDNATAGGYELRFSYADQEYGAAFRVAEYVKPHFEIAFLPDKPAFKTGEAVTGKLQLAYPDGKPVANASIQLSVRAQAMTMVDGDLGYSGQFPVKLTTDTLTSDRGGVAKFALPAAKDPSRYVLTAFATDGAAYRVKLSKELLIERASGAFNIAAERQFSAAGERIGFRLTPTPDAQASGVAPATWEWVRLEDRSRDQGKVADAKRLELTFANAGSYTLTLRDAQGNVVGAASHWVSGNGLQAPAGSIEIVFDQPRYQPGSTAQALITFPEPIDEALFTLERDKVEQTALLTRAQGWIKATRIAPNQWRAELPVREDYSPNVTLSVAYAKRGDYVFQNHGLLVEQPRIELQFKPDKEVYAPREKVTIAVTATLAGKPVAATLAVGVVDEMIYVLQPELAPNLFDFFHHPRRNNVRTSASLSFISYDLAARQHGEVPSRRAQQERGVKLLERPRRDDVDTAYWQPVLTTDANGRATFSFTMPDSLTRWRITGRAVDASGASGAVGQKVAHIRSEQPYYVKWTAPQWLRQGDQPQASIAVFNQTRDAQTVELAVTGGGVQHTAKLDLKPGVTYAQVPLAQLSAETTLAVVLRRDGKPLDQLALPYRKLPQAWASPRTQAIPLTAANLPLKLPADASEIQVEFGAAAASQFQRIFDDLIDYPYGCVEQTASRMIPLALAIQSVGSDADRVLPRLTQRLATARLRLAHMAGPEARFGWWGTPGAEASDADTLLTGYAYYADWQASRVLGLTLPPEHWGRLLNVYAAGGEKLPPVQRALMLSWMREMELPVRSLVGKLLDDLATTELPAKPDLPASSSPLLGRPDAGLANAVAIVLAVQVARDTQAPVPEPVAKLAEPAAALLKQADAPVAHALLLVSKRLPAAEADRVLGGVRAEMPTLDRAMALAWTQQALGGKPTLKATGATLGAPWIPVVTTTGRTVYRLPAGTPVPATLNWQGSPDAPVTALLRYQSAAREDSKLNVGLERSLYLLEKAKDGSFDLTPVKPGTALRTDALYLDEITLQPAGKTAHRYGIVEVPLPPGGTVEPTTWGVKLRQGKDAEAMERARFEPTPFGYAIPVDTLSETTTVRHLLRFSQKGRYTLPPARYYRMYQPEQKAIEGGEREFATLDVK